MDRDLLGLLASLAPGDELPDLAAGILGAGRPAWHARAACRGKGPAVFFAASTGTAVEVCAGCEVRPECAEAGEDEPEGVWGGLTAPERSRLRKDRGV